LFIVEIDISFPVDSSWVPSLSSTTMARLSALLGLRSLSSMRWLASSPTSGLRDELAEGKRQTWHAVQQILGLCHIRVVTNSFIPMLEHHVPPRSVKGCSGDESRRYAEQLLDKTPSSLNWNLSHWTCSGCRLRIHEAHVIEGVVARPRLTNAQNARLDELTLFMLRLLLKLLRIESLWIVQATSVAPWDGRQRG